MTSLTTETEIAAPLERVFEVFTDLEHSAEYVSNIRNIEVLTAGGFAPGARWLETRDMLGVLDTAEMEVTAYVHNSTYTITHHKAGAQVNAVFTFDRLDGRTRVRVEFALEGPGLPPGALAPLRWAIAGKVREVIGRDLADLKAVIEREDKNH
jgi:uncharacterized protein YndB with AHSA1/START domain